MNCTCLQLFDLEVQRSNRKILKGNEKELPKKIKIYVYIYTNHTGCRRDKSGASVHFSWSVFFTQGIPVRKKKTGRRLVG